MLVQNSLDLYEHSSWISKHFISWKASTPRTNSQRKLFIARFYVFLKYRSCIIPPPKKSKNVCHLLFSRKRHLFLWWLECKLVNTEYFVITANASRALSTCRINQSFLIALLESVLLETKLHWVNGLYGASADIQVIMISFAVWKYMFVISDFFLLINVISCGGALFYIPKSGTNAPTVHVLYKAEVNHLYGLPHPRRRCSCSPQ